jgi:hypothetical protein
MAREVRPHAAWGGIISAVYVASVWVWLAEAYRVLPGPHLLETNLSGGIINLGMPIVVGLAVRRWWVVSLPLASLVIAVPLSLAGADGRGADPLSPVVAAAFISILYGVPGAVAGVSIGKLWQAQTSRRAFESPSRLVVDGSASRHASDASE